MTDCREFDPQSASWTKHAELCHVCATQLLAHQNLEGVLGQAPPPRLSTEFSAAVRLRVAQQTADGTLGRRRRAFMLAYWTAFALASLLVLARLAEVRLSGSVLGLTALLGVGVMLSIPLIVLGWRRRISLSELVLSTWW